MLRQFKSISSAKIARSGDVDTEMNSFKCWDSPHLLSNQFQLLAKCIEALNVNVPSEELNVNSEKCKELELTIINVFSHQMMPSWLALAKSYYPFYIINDADKSLIESLEQKLDIKSSDFSSLTDLLKKFFLSHYPAVNSQYQVFIENVKNVMAKLTAVALSTPALINDAHQHDNKQYEEAGPSMSNCISPIETILRHLMNREEVGKPFIISATSLLLQVKAIKSYFEQITLIQKLERIEYENKKLQENPALNSQKLEEELHAWQSKEEQMALVYLFKLQKQLNQYYEHLTDLAVKLPMDKKVTAKLACVTLMKNNLDKEALVPSMRIKTFKQQLTVAVDELKEHRDPMWMRFLRDCFRILMFTFSGIAVYRILTDQSVQFFKPSHGQRFIENSSHIIGEMLFQPG